MLSVAVVPAGHTHFPPDKIPGGVQLILTVDCGACVSGYLQVVVPDICVAPPGQLGITSR